MLQCAEIVVNKGFYWVIAWVMGKHLTLQANDINGFRAKFVSPRLHLITYQTHNNYAILLLDMFMEKLKKTFKVSSTYQLVVVFIVFGITGSLSLYISDYVLEILELENLIISIFMVLITYQTLLIIIGTLFGEFKYFWAMEKKILSRFKIN